MAEGSTFELLATRVGEGVTGYVAKTGLPFLTGDAANAEIGRQIEGTERIEESLLAVPPALRAAGGRRDRRLEARARPVRRRRSAPARGARGTRLGRPRQRAPLRGPAQGGGEREGAPRSLARALVADRPRCRHRPDRARSDAHHRLSQGVGVAAGARRRRPRLRRRVARGRRHVRGRPAHPGRRRGSLLRSDRAVDPRSGRGGTRRTRARKARV